MKKITYTITLLLLLLSLPACGKTDAAKYVESEIEKLSTITIDSMDTILKIEDAYNSLTEEEKLSIKNYDKFISDKATLKEVITNDLSDFIKTNPYPCGTEDYTTVYRIDMELIQQYNKKLEALDKMSITESDCPQYAYAKAVSDLAQYEEYNEFLKGYYQTKDIANEGFNDLNTGLQAYSLGNNDIGFSYFNTAATKFESAEATANKLDQNATNVAEYTECLSLIAAGSTNYASGTYLNNNAISGVGEDTILENIQKLSTYFQDAKALIDEISTIEKTIETCNQ